MQEIHLNIYQASALAALVLLLGRFLVNRVSLFSKYCIPQPVLGGIVYALLMLALHHFGHIVITFDDTLQTFFMIVFFTSVGFLASFQLLKKGGIQVVIFLTVIIGLVLLQDIVGCVLAGLFGLDPRIGLCVGSISMVGGHGTAASFGSLLEKAGVTGAASVAVAAATFGLIAGSMLGGPIGRLRIVQHHLHSTVKQSDTPEIETITQVLDNDRFLNAAICFAIAVGCGEIVMNVLASLHFTVPVYIGAMLCAAIMRNLFDAFHKELPIEEITVLGSLSLSLFLAMALMGLKLWQLVDLALPLVVMLLAQTVLVGFFAYSIVFRTMGKDYEAAVMSAATCGFGMGATPNAMANMQAITLNYGPAPRAFFVVPLVGSLFIDFFNSAIIAIFLNFLS